MGLLVGLALAGSSFALASPALGASEGYAYDPVLSLTGSCSPSEASKQEDPVADPGCPGSHPPKGFEVPCGTAVDRLGDIYVATPANFTNGKDGRIDVFDAEGRYLTEISDKHEPCGLAVDSQGAVYSRGGAIGSAGVVSRYKPTEFPPKKDTKYEAAIVYDPADHGDPGGTPCLVVQSIAVDPSNNHLYLGHGCRIEEYGSASEGSPLIDEEAIAEEAGYRFRGIDIYGENQDLYVTAKPNNENLGGEVFVFDSADGHAKCEVADGESGPFKFGLFSAIAIDQANGEFYVWELERKQIDRFAVEGEACNPVGHLPQPPTLSAPDGFDDLAVDDPLEAGEAGYSSPNAGNIYVTSGTGASNSHLFAFKFRVIGPPEIRAQAATEITETDATLQAEVNPKSLHTSYHFEYTTQAEFDAHEFESAVKVPATDASAGNGGAFKLVSEPLIGLEAGVAYRFRLVASNCDDVEAEAKCLTKGEGESGEEGDDASFATYPAPPSQSCPNADLRTGASAALPDCRAYELVTPPDTNGRIPTMAMLGGNFSFSGFDTTMVSPDGKSLVFGSDSGSLPEIGGSGYADTYEALRDQSSGWQSSFTGLIGAQAQSPHPGGISPDHGYSFWYVSPGDSGTLANGGKEAHLLRVPVGTKHSPGCAVSTEPEGSFEWLACGSLGFDPSAPGMWISPGGDHVIFQSTQHLEECAAPKGTNAIYDRTPGGATRCISLLPGEVKPVGGDNANYLGKAADGSAIAFELGGTLYVRVDDLETLEVANGLSTFGGISRDGNHVFYLKGGDAFVFDTEDKATTKIGSGGETTLVNISADGSHVYFASPKELDAGAKLNKKNLYVWDETGVHFIALLDPLDISGEGGFGAQGLGFWVTSVVNPRAAVNVGPADDPSRATPDGSVLVFESRADLTGESGEQRAIYRYEEAAAPGEQLRCVSCNPTDAPSGSPAQLESPPPGSPLQPFPPVNSLTQIANVSIDGGKVFFQSADRLVARDLDKKVDVYEWEAGGVGGCQRASGCLALISSSHSGEDEYLYAMTPDGSDVFFLSADTLASTDHDGTPSIYDAREGGGFPESPSPPKPCLGEACQPGVVPPADITPASSSFEGQENQHSCPKGKRKVSKDGKARCVNRHRKKHGSTMASKHTHHRGIRSGGAR
jgi:hypothetical protein